MSARVHTLAAFAFLALATPLRGQTPPDSGAAASRVLVTREDIARAGWSRLSEVLAAAGWDVVSMDGFLVDASADALPSARLSAAGQPDWTLLVDGQRVPVRAAGARLLELAPVSIAQVESVTVRRLPSLAAGRVATRGVVHVYTRRALAPAMRALYAVGNERGDPGPYRYTALSSPNVERLGPDATAALLAGGVRGDAQVSARYSTMNITDEALLPRLDSTVGAFGRGLFQKVSSVAGRAGTNVGGGRHDLLAGVSRFEGVLYQPARDDWARATIGHLGLSGDAPVGSVVRVRYSVAHSRTEVDTLSPNPSPTLARRQGATTGHAEVAMRVGESELAIGASGGRWTFERDRDVRERADATAFARIATAAVGRTVASATLAAARSGDRTALQALAEAAVRLRGGSSLALAAGHAPQVVDGEGWLDGITASPGGRDAAEEPPKLTWADVAWRVVRGATRAELGGTLTAARDWRVRTPDGEIAGDARIGTARAGFEAALGARLVARGEYRLAVARSARDDVARALDATPRHGARLLLSTTRLPGNLRLSAAMHGRSATDWPAVDSAGASRTLDALLRLDATVEKWFWRDRVRGFLSARNLLDGEERYHPEGALFGLRAHLGVDVELR